MRPGAVAAPGSALGARAFAFVSAVPGWAWLAALVVVSAGVRFALAVRNPGPWIFQDEVVYWELATSFGHTGAFALRDVPGTGGFGVVYPALISPAAALFDSPTAAYTAAKAINALLMSLAAIPVYFLARRLAGVGLSLLAALLAVAVPGLVYTAAIMTENAFYPVVACFALLLVLMLEEPTALRQIAVFAVIALAYFTRAQAAILVLVVLTAIVLVVLAEAWSGRYRLRRLVQAFAVYNVTWLVLAVTAAGVVLIQVVRGTSPRDLLGAYEGVADSGFPPGEVARWFVYHLADLDLAVGLFPFGALVVVALLAFRSPRQSPRLFVFAAAALSLVFWFTLSVSAYTSTPGADRISERHLFHVVPLFFVALVAWIARGLPRPLWAVAPAVAATSGLVATIPYGDFLNGTTAHSTFSLVPLWSLQRDLSLAPNDILIVVALAGVAAGIVLALVPRRLVLAMPAVVLVYLAVGQGPVEGITAKAAREELHAGIGVTSPDGKVDRSWVDRVAGPGADVAWLWSGEDIPWPVWETEFFNESIGSVYSLEAPIDGLPQATVAIDDEGFLRLPDGRAVRADYVLAPESVALAGALVAADGRIGPRLFRVAGPVKIAESTEGIYLDRWAGPEVAYTRYGCSGGTVTVHLAGFAPLHPRPQTVVATVGGREAARATVPVGATDAHLRVPLEPSEGRCEVRFTVTPTAVPAEVLPSTDTRELGVQFLGFEYDPGGRP